VLGAYTRGWELLIRIGLAAPGSFQARGFQVTSVGGALVAAMVAAELGGLDEAQAVAAMGIALSQASGVFEFLSNGATVKSLHPGWAAHAGVIAANLARAGLTGPQTSFEGRFGLFRAFAGDHGAASRLSEQIGSFGLVWHLADAAFKFHPCCHYLHPFVEAAGLLAGKGVQADAIEHILCHAPAGAAGIICEPWALKQAPETGHAARWSLPAVVAARLVEGKVDLDTFEQKPSPAVLALAARIDWEPLVNDRFPEKFEAELSIRLKDGTVHEVRVDDVYGNRSRPAEAERVREKFRANAARSLASAQVAQLEQAIETIEGAPDLNRLTQVLGNGA
jgi:2-methylcitrate dehydratase PrpD